MSFKLCLLIIYFKKRRKKVTKTCEKAAIFTRKDNKFTVYGKTTQGLRCLTQGCEISWKTHTHKNVIFIFFYIFSVFRNVFLELNKKKNFYTSTWRGTGFSTSCVPGVKFDPFFKNLYQKWVYFKLHYQKSKYKCKYLITTFIEF